MGIFSPVGNTTKKTELPKYLKTLLLEKFIFGVTSALISVLLMVLLFVSHTNILSVKSWYSRCPEVLRKELCGVGRW